MKIDLPYDDLNQYEIVEIQYLLSKQKKGLTDLEQIWYLMDLIWDEKGCDNKSLDWKKISDFYSHPVWLLNGFFIEQDELSMQHRYNIHNWIVQIGSKEIIDYGGGFCTLACLIAKTNSEINIDVYEPHPSDFGLKRIAQFENIKLISGLKKQYDCLVSTDVLEHVVDPLKNLSEMIDSVKINGYLVIANAFFPMIKCHLPKTFHFRYSFSLFARLMGLEKIGELDGSHAMIYKKVSITRPNWYLIKFLEGLSKLIFPLLEILKKLIGFFKRNFNK